MSDGNEEKKATWYIERFTNFGKLAEAGKLHEALESMGTERVSPKKLSFYLKREKCVEDYKNGIGIELLARRNNVKLETARGYIKSYIEEFLQVNES